MSANVSKFINNLQKSPSYPKYKSYHWVDYIELLCLANIDNQISKADLVDRLAERESDLGEGDIDESIAMEKLKEEGSEIATMRSSMSDIWNEKVEDWFRLIEHRIAIYKDYYPFVLRGNVIFLKNEDLTCEQGIYIYLLYCSNLYLLDRTDSQSFSSSFELLCLRALKNILPNGSMVDIFGKNPLNKGKYSGSLWDKIVLLASDLNEPVLAKKDNYPPQNTGDDGLDLVGIIPTGDSLPAKLIFFAQCACTPDWVSKQHSSSNATWRNRIHLTTPVNNVLFIPFCFRNAEGNWAKMEDISESFILDRRRLINYLRNDNEVLKKLPTYGLVNDLIVAKENVF